MKTVERNHFLKRTGETNLFVVALPSKMQISCPPKHTITKTFSTDNRKYCPDRDFFPTFSYFSLSINRIKDRQWEHCRF